jgi:translocation and assembly module TamA
MNLTISKSVREQTFSALLGCVVMFCSPNNAAATVLIEGVEDDLLANVLAHVSIDDETCDAPDWRVRRVYKEADAEIATALEAFGHYSSEINKTLTVEDDCWVATFAIDPGPVVTLRTVGVRFDGEDTELFRDIVKNVPLQTDQVLNHAEYEAYKNRFVTRANQWGYFSGQFTESRIDVYPDLLVADITLAYDPGRRYKFGDLRITQEVVSEKLADGYIDFAVGQPYDASRISRLYEALLGSGYFSGVDIRTTPRGEPDFDVPVTIRLDAAKHRSYNGGVGFATDTGPKVRIGYINRLRNDKGHQLELNASFSPVITEIGASYKFPLKNPRKAWLNVDTGFKSEDTDTVTSEIYKIGLKRFNRRTESWLETWFLDYSLENYEVGVTDDGRSRLLTPGISWAHTPIAGPPRPMRGFRANLRLSAAADVMLSDTSFIQAHAFGKIIRPLWSSARVIGRAEFGATLRENFVNLPASVRFFAGGDQSVRGYEYQSLGPKDPFGAVVGGGYLAVFSVELDQRVRDNWSVAVFVDTGNAFDNFDNDVSLETGVGAGIRWYSPLGPIRFDVAVPLASDAEDSYRIHITLGPDL